MAVNVCRGRDGQCVPWPLSRGVVAEVVKVCRGSRCVEGQGVSWPRWSMCVMTIVKGCRGRGRWPRSMAEVVCGRGGPWPRWSVAEVVRGRGGLWPRSMAEVDGRGGQCGQTTSHKAHAHCNMQGRELRVCLGAAFPVAFALRAAFVWNATARGADPRTGASPVAHGARESPTDHPPVVQRRRVQLAGLIALVGVAAACALTCHLRRTRRSPPAPRAPVPPVPMRGWRGCAL